jgi:glycosyltransferase involved in cell wall biosynthesis
MTGYDIVLVGLQPYDSDIGTNTINIAEEFAKQNRVLYVNYPLDKKSFRIEKHLQNIQKRAKMIAGETPNLIEVKPQLWNLYPNCLLESINGIPFTSIFKLFNYFNNKKFAIEIAEAIKKLGFKDFILFNDTVMLRGFYLQEFLKPKISIYYTRDNMMSVPYWFKHGHLLEPKLMAKSDLVCANSTYLAEVATAYNKKTFYVGQGCDISAFDPNKQTEKPKDILHLTGPIIGYIGTLFTLRLDIKIIKQIAAYNSNWTVLLIGPEDEAFKRSELHNLPNVHFLGFKDSAELPNYLKYFDVAINPQILNPTTIGNYPRKIDEYLAMGKPVVATETKAMSIFKDHTYLAKSPEEYPPLIEKALSENSQELESQRIKFAHSHTWENSVKEIYNAIQTVNPNIK